jgi:hypothetical protein
VDDVFPGIQCVVTLDRLDLVTAQYNRFSEPRSPPQLHEEVPPNPQPPTLANDVYDHDDEETNLRAAPATGNPPVPQEPYSGYRDSQSASITETLKEKLTIQRISPAVSTQSHFSFASPLPAQFQHRFRPPDPPPTDEERLKYIKRALAKLELSEEQPLPPAAQGSRYKKFASSNRDPERVLVRILEAGLRDSVARLDVGDAFCHRETALGTSGGRERPTETTEEEIVARWELVDVLSGRSMIFPFEENGNPVSDP